MAGVPFIFGNATTSIPLSNLDANFNTGVTIGNTTVGLGNTVTTLGNVTLTNATIVANTSSIAANAVVYTTSTGNLTGNASVFTVDSSGNVGIGITSAAAKLHVFKTLVVDNGWKRNAVFGDTSYNLFLDTQWTNSQGIWNRLGQNFNGTDTSSIEFGPGSSGYIAFNVNSATAERMRIDSSGRVLVGLTSANTSGANLQVSQGITFPATQSASSDANTLDDYEEGTWTPSWTSLTVVGTPTYTGKYIKVGRLVFCQLSIVSTTSTASTANITFFTGLPFAMTASDGNNSTMTAVNNTNVTSYGVGLVNSGVAYTPTWLASSNIVLSFSYMATN